MQINDRRKISKKRDYVTLYHEMMFEQHKILAPLHHELSNLSPSKIAAKALANPEKARDITLYMIVRENVGHCWQEHMLFNYNCEFGYQSYKFDESERGDYLGPHVDELVQGVNSSSKLSVQKICYDAIHMLDMEDELIGKKISLDRDKSQKCAIDQIQFIENYEENQSEVLWQRIESRLYNFN